MDPESIQLDQLVINLWKSLLPSNETENMILSPYSVITALIMLLMGAQGPTKTEIGKVVFNVDWARNGWWSSMYWMQHDDAYLDSKVKMFGEANREMILRNGATLKEANWMYSSNDIEIIPEFALNLNERLNATLKQLDFGAQIAESLESINSDVNQSTGGMIPRILESIDPSTKLYLINTLYFKDVWLKPFDKKDTKLDGEFNKSNGEVIKCPLMFQKGIFGYYHNPESGVKAVKLQYRKSQVSMLLILPPESVPVQTYIRSLNPSSLNTILDNLAKTDVSKLVLPRFNLSGTHKLISTLRKLGIKSAFNSGNFSGITKNPVAGLVVSEVFQKVVIECTEAGTEASAATVFRIQSQSQQQQPPPGVEFEANRPFAFALYEENPQDSKKRNVLFVGTVEDPTRE